MAIAEAELQADIQPGMEITEDELMRLPRDGRKWISRTHGWEAHGSADEHITRRDHLQPDCPAHAVRARTRHRHPRARRVPHDQRQRPRPDVSFTRNGAVSRRPCPEYFRRPRARLLCVEIISPSDKRAEIDRKVRDYFDNGAQLVWHVFPERQQVIVFTSPAETRTLNADDTLTAGDLLPGFSCRVGDLFILE